MRFVRYIRARVRPCFPCVPCVSRLPPVSFYRYSTMLAQLVDHESCGSTRGATAVPCDSLAMLPCHLRPATDAIAIGHIQNMGACVSTVWAVI